MKDNKMGNTWYTLIKSILHFLQENLAQNSHLSPLSKVPKTFAYYGTPELGILYREGQPQQLGLS